MTNTEEISETYYIHPVYTSYGIEVIDYNIPKPFKITDVYYDNSFDYKYIKPSARMCDGYIGLSINKGFYYLHRFIVECIESKELKKEEEVDHKDGIKHHNNINNLQILSHSKNMKKVKKQNYHCYVSTESEMNSDTKEFFNLYDIVEYTDLSAPVIYAMLSGQIKGYAVNKNKEKFWFSY